MTGRSNSHTSSRIYVLVVAFLAVGIGGAGYFFYEKEVKQIKSEEQDELTAIADLKTEQIVRWREERMGDALFILKNPFVASPVQGFLDNPTAQDLREKVLKWMKSLQEHFAYQDIYLFDRKGDLQLSVTSPPDNLSSHTVSLVPQAISGAEPIFFDLHKDEKQGDIHLDFFIPLSTSGKRESTPYGLLLLRIHPEEFLFPLVQSWPTPSGSAETVLIRREGDELVYLNELRYLKNTALTLRLPISEDRLPSAMAGRGVEGMVEGLDYRGVPVLAVVRKISDSPWFLIAKVDAEEIYAPIRERTTLAAVFVGLLLVAAGAVVGVFERRQRALTYRRQYESELERRALAEQYEYLVKYANDIILLMDEQLNLVDANDRALKAYGYTHDEIRQLSLKDLRSLETLAALDGQLKEARETNGAVYETEHRRKDGRTFPVEVSSRLITMDGKLFYQSIIRDITERKRAEESLKLFRTLVDQSNDGIHVVDPETARIIDSNEKAWRALGYSREEFLSLRVFDIDPTVAESAFPKLTEELRNSGFMIWEGYQQRKDGSKFPVEVNIRYVQLDKGYVIAVIRDMTERKKALDELIRLRKAVDASGEAIFLTDVDGTFTFANAEFSRLYGYAHAEVVGKVTPRILKGGRMKSEDYKIFWKYLLSGKIVKREMINKTKDGRFINIEGSTSPIFDESRNIIGFLAVQRDIGQRKEAEAQLRRSQAELRALASRLQTIREQERMRIARELHDELGQALTGLRFDVTWLEQSLPRGSKSLRKKTHQISALVEKTIEEIRRIANDLRPSVLDDFGLYAAIEWQVKGFERRIGIPCKICTPSRPPPIDETHAIAIFRICQETLTNVARHSNATEVAVSLRETAGNLLLEITDNGKGIKSAELEARSSLGIIGMRERALQLGGRLILEGKPGEGTRVSLMVPLISETSS